MADAFVKNDLNDLSSHESTHSSSSDKKRNQVRSAAASESFAKTLCALHSTQSLAGRWGDVVIGRIRVVHLTGALINGSDRGVARLCCPSPVPSPSPTLKHLRHGGDSLPLRGSLMIRRQITAIYVFRVKCPVGVFNQATNSESPITAAAAPLLLNPSNNV